MMMEKDLIRPLITAVVLVYGSVSAEVVLDLVGPMDGSGIGEVVTANQYFEPSYASFNIAVLENISLQSDIQIAEIELVINGWDGFIDPSSIPSFETNVYSDPEVAIKSLSGDIATNQVDAADTTASSEWYGDGFLVQVPTQMNVTAGLYWFGVIPTNEYKTNGQVGVANTNLGDGIFGMQVNPGEGFGFGPIRELSTEAAYRVHDNVLNDPCSIDLPPFCAEDINEDGFVTVLDLLEVIAQWGVCGDGSFRPTADCAPLPLGDCCVNVADILAIVAAWEAVCAPHGACCLTDGICEEITTQQSCLLGGGVYFGDDTICAIEECFTGACCVDVICVESSQFECLNLEGIFQGDGTTCVDIDCAAVQEGDECLDALPAYEGATPFSTLLMTPSEPQPDEAPCEVSNLVWAESPDVWFSFTAPSSGDYNFSLCDLDSYDTSMVLYEADCSNQVACNGDTFDPDEECQQYFSEISYTLEESETYFVRIGGWFSESGNGTLTIGLLPPPLPGACCFADGSCLEDTYEHDCEAFSGTFAGEYVSCIEADCIVIEGDECEEAVDVYVGSRSFTTMYASPSTPEPSEWMCPDTDLEWGNSPDIWLRWLSPDDGFATFSTCDPDSFDTSIVLYEETCSNQIACNGDTDPNTDCQNYYSYMEYKVSAGTVYYIRIGGWQGTTGPGTLTITLDGENDVAACCVLGVCYNEQTEVQCDDLGGDWMYGETCKTFDCESIPCYSSIFTQVVHGPDEGWFAGNSSYDGPTSQFNRAEYVNLPAMNSLSVWGLQAYFNGSSWSSCDEDALFTVRTYEDLSGLPGPRVDEALFIPATKTATGTLYAGIYELKQFDLDFSAMNVEHISVQSESENLDCWFLWISSATGDGVSTLNSGNGWVYENTDLSICIE